MTDSVPTWRSAWEPFTPRGVAAFAGGSFGRLFLVQSLMAALAAASVAFFLQHAWFPVVNSAIVALPAEGDISHGQLNWSGDPHVSLAQNRFLSLAVDLDHSGQLGREAHLQVEFGRHDFRLYSQFGLGYVACDYLPDREMPFNRNDLVPWWGAWKPFILTAVFLATFVSLMVTWAVLATLYFLPVWVISFLENRDLNLRQSWRLAGAALMPGALFMILGILGYALTVLDVLRLGTVLGLHFIVAWIYLMIGPLFCPRPAEARKTPDNPFSTAKKTNENPFAAGQPAPAAPEVKTPPPENEKTSR